MEQVVTINLNGNAYQLDESAYAALRAYLAGADQALGANPDRADIIADIEQAIAEKCTAFMGPGRTVIARAEMDRALEEMGPVEDDVDGDESGAPKVSAEAPQSDAGAKPNDGERRSRRLYRLPDGAMIAGVCNGLAAYFDIDPVLMRLGFILIAIITHGFAVIGYIVLMFVIPTPATSEEWAAAHRAPFNAQEVIDRAKKEYQDFADSGGFQTRWSYRRTRRVMRRARRAQRRAASAAAYWSGAYAPYRTPPVGPAGAVARGVAGGVAGGIAGLFALIFGLVSVALVIAFVVVLISLLATGAILGWTPPGDIPLWALIVITIIIFSVINSPFRAMRRANYYSMGGPGYVVHHTFDGFVWIGVLALCGWLAYLYVPAAHAWLDQVPIWANDAYTTISRNLAPR